MRGIRTGEIEAFSHWNIVRRALILQGWKGDYVMISKVEHQRHGLDLIKIDNDDTKIVFTNYGACLLYTSPSPRD